MPKPTYHSGLFNVYLDGEKYWEYLEMGKDTDELYPEHFRTEELIPQYKRIMDKLVWKDEVYILLEGHQFDYVVTSLGRVFNAKKRNQIKAYQHPSSQNLSFTCRNDKLFLKEVFKKQKWDYNYDYIVEFYHKHNWAIGNHDDYK